MNSRFRIDRSAALAPLVLLCVAGVALGQTTEDLKKSLAFHATFDRSLDADFSRGDPRCVVKQGAQDAPLQLNEEVEIDSAAGKFGGALHFLKKGKTWPRYDAVKVLGYNPQDWNATVSVWLRTTPDEDLQPGYCDPVQIIGDDNKKGFIFLEWSKDETPRYFRFAIRPLFPIWNPTNVPWADIPFEKRPMVQVSKAPFSRDRWTHVAFTLSHLNSKSEPPTGRLYLDGKLQGSIDKWNLTLDWDPSQIALVLGAAYVGYLDDFAVFDRTFNEREIDWLFRLEQGVAALH